MDPQTTQLPEVHLLWPAASPGGNTRPLGDRAVADLGLGTLAEALALRPKDRDAFRQFLREMCFEPETIRYRQDVLQDCLENHTLAAGLEALLPRLAQLAFLRDYPYTMLLERVVNRLGELETYVDCVRQLRELLESEGVTLHSEGFRRLLEALRWQERQPVFQALAEQLPELRARASGVASITVGINLDNQLRPVGATLLSLNDRPFTGTKDTLLSRLLGEVTPDGDEYRGIARLHVAPDSLPGASSSRQEGRRPDPFLFPLFRDLDQVLRRALEPVAHALQAYVSIQSRALVELEAEIAFLLSGVRLVRRMQAAGLAMCRPEIAPPEARLCQMRGMVNPLLALRMLERSPDQRPAIVANDVDFGDAGRVLILTGPNQGGKTTFTQGVGIAQVLFQAGLYVPAGAARISPVDAIYTHFPLEERPETEAGRLGEEAQRLNAIFQSATAHSLVLLNESLTTTSPGESIYLARDIVRALRLWGLRAIFVTHMHELAENVDALNESTPGESRIASLVAGIAGGESEQEARRSYRIVPAPPIGLSYAKDIARRYGISYEQLAATRHTRNHP